MYFPISLSESWLKSTLSRAVDSSLSIFCHTPLLSLANSGEFLSGSSTAGHTLSCHIRDTSQFSSRPCGPNIPSISFLFAISLFNSNIRDSILPSLYSSVPGSAFSAENISPNISIDTVWLPSTRTAASSALNLASILAILSSFESPSKEMPLRSSAILTGSSSIS